MRNLFILTMAVAGAWLMVQTSQQWAATILNQGGAGQNPLAALVFVPALLLGACLGALLAGLICPGR